MGMNDLQIDAVLELDLVRYHEEKYTPDLNELMAGITSLNTIGWFKLTDLGERVRDEIEEK
jgi:hypothetical protein